MELPRIRKYTFKTLCMEGMVAPSPENSRNQNAHSGSNVKSAIGQYKLTPRVSHPTCSCSCSGSIPLPLVRKSKLCIVAIVCFTTSFRGDMVASWPWTAILTAPTINAERVQGSRSTPIRYTLSQTKRVKGLLSAASGRSDTLTVA